jgi:hypothetical protein
MVITKPGAAAPAPNFNRERAEYRCEDARARDNSITSGRRGDMPDVGAGRQPASLTASSLALAIKHRRLPSAGTSERQRRHEADFIIR